MLMQPVVALLEPILQLMCLMCQEPLPLSVLIVAGNEEDGDSDDDHDQKPRSRLDS